MFIVHINIFVLYGYFHKQLNPKILFPKEHSRTNELNHVFLLALLIFVFFSLYFMPVKVNLIWLTVLLSNASKQPHA